MDEMKIVSNFTKGIISKILKTVIRKKFGYNIDVELNGITAMVNDGNMNIHLDVDAKMEKEELMKILKNIGL